MGPSQPTHDLFSQKTKQGKRRFGKGMQLEKGHQVSFLKADNYGELCKRYPKHIRKAFPMDQWETEYQKYQKKSNRLVEVD
jgi:hypothetical protein